jgi:signal transduction histidine kinase
MNLLEYSAIIATVFFGLISLYLTIKQRQAALKIQKTEEVEKQRLYQITILKEIQDRIGYSLDAEKIIEVITGSLKHLFPYSTASSMVIKSDKIIFRSYVEENINSYFILQVRKSMLASLRALVANLPEKVDELSSGVPLDETKTAPVSSFFNIPLIIGNRIVGLINVSSTNKNLYKEDEVTILYQIVAQASNAMSKLQDLLENEKGKLTSMISSLADGVFMVDTHKNLLIINEAAKTFLNISNPNPSLNDLLVSVGAAYNLSDKIDECIKNNKTIEEKEIEVNDRIFQTFITPVPNAREENRHEPIGASILLHDITIEKNFSRIKEDFTHMIVHELRAPLTAIKDSSELMIEVFDDKGNLEKEQQKRLLKIIDVQSKSLLEQINQVLDAAKMEAGRFTIEKIMSDMGEVIEASIEPFLPQANKKQILISTDIYYPLPNVEFDPTRISQVLYNLISNSLKFTPAGGKIIVSAKPEKGVLTVSVSDNGIGIPESEQKNLFSKYYQLRTTPRQLAKKGTGLGLYIIKGIVEAHKGSVGVISKEGQGTTIFFNLPFEGGGPRIIQGHLEQNKMQPVSSLVN